MRRHLELEERLRGPWSQLGGELHPEDAFVCRWMRWLSPASTQREAARAVALAGLDQIEDPDGDWNGLSLEALVAALPNNDGGWARRCAQHFVTWLTLEGKRDASVGRPVHLDLEALRCPSDRNVNAGTLAA